MEEHLAAGRPLSAAYLVWNREEVPESAWEAVERRFPKLTERFDFDVVSPSELPTLVAEIKKRVG